jgi:hypothetical protein
MEVANLSIAVNSDPVVLADQRLASLVKTGAGLGLGIDMLHKMEDAFSSLADYAEKAVLNAARFETLGVVMGVVGKNAYYTAQEMEGFTKSLEKTGISMLESRQSLTRMAEAHIDLASATKLGRIAQDAAVIANINSSEAFQRMTWAIETGQVRMLRTLGINVNLQTSYTKLAAELHKTVAELTVDEQMQARVNAVMEKGKDIHGAYEASMQTLGKQLNSSVRYFEDLSTSIGEIAEPVASLVMFPLVTWLKDASEGTKKFVESADGRKFIDNIVNPVEGVIHALGMYVGWVNKAVEATISWKGLIITVGGSITLMLVAPLYASSVAALTAGWSMAKLAISTGMAAFAFDGYFMTASAAKIATDALSASVTFLTTTALGTLLVALAAVAAGLAVVYAGFRLVAGDVVGETKRLEEANRKAEEHQRNVAKPLEDERAIWKTLAAERKAYEDAKAGGKSTKDAMAAAEVAKLAAEEKRLYEQRRANGWTADELATWELYKTKVAAEKAAAKIRADEAENEERQAKGVESDTNNFRQEKIKLLQGENAAYMFGETTIKKYTAAAAGTLNGLRQEVAILKEKKSLGDALYASTHGELDVYSRKLSQTGDFSTSTIDELVASKSLAASNDEIRKIQADTAALGKSELEVYEQKLRLSGKMREEDIKRTVLAKSNYIDEAARTKVLEDSNAEALKNAVVLERIRNGEAAAYRLEMSQKSIGKHGEVLPAVPKAVVDKGLQDKADIALATEKASQAENLTAILYGENAAYAKQLELAGLLNKEERDALVAGRGFNAFKQEEKALTTQLTTALYGEAAAYRAANIEKGITDPKEQARLQTLKDRNIVVGLTDIAEQNRLETERKALLAEGAATIGIERTNRALRDNALAQDQLRANAGETWPMIRGIVSQSTGAATDGMVAWMNSTNGVARSWRTLGDTIKSVVADMLVEMEKAIVKTQLMKPIIDWASNGNNWSTLGTSIMGLFGGGKADGGSVSGGTSYLVGERGPEIFTPSTGGRITPNHELGGTHTSITIHITNNGQDSSSSGSGNSDQALALGKLIGAKVREIIVQESRQNGLLSRS